MTTALYQPMIGEPAPLFELLGTDGKAYSLADFRDTFVVIHFGASW
jgi:peroxiredoxin